MLSRVGAAESWCYRELVLPRVGAAESWCCRELVLPTEGITKVRTVSFTREKSGVSSGDMEHCASISHFT